MVANLLTLIPKRKVLISKAVRTGVDSRCVLGGS